MRCPECGSDLPDSTTLCPSCGATLNAADTGKAGGGDSFIKRHLERFLLAGGMLAIAGGIGILAFIALLGGISSNFLGNNRLFGDAPAAFATVPLDHANPYTGLLQLVIVGIIVATILTAQGGRIPFIRRIAGLNAIDEAVGRATEMGRPILFSGGLAGLGIVSLQALAVASHVARSAVRYGTRLIMPVCDQTMLPITEEVIREVYTAEGRSEAYKPEDIRYLSDRQFAYAAGVTGIMHREKVAASFLFGQFYAESLILAENGQAVGAIQVAGTPDLLQIPFFVVSCDYTIIGDEYYAASAYLSREPTQLGSLVGQDIGKALLLILIIAGIAWSIFQHNNPIMQFLGGGG
ncbi:MAG: DUF6754 domain-containing protein [Armatimonadota bacterium]